MPSECRNGSSTAPSSANRAAAFWPCVTAARNSSSRVLASFIVMAFRNQTFVVSQGSGVLFQIEKPADATGASRSVGPANGTPCTDSPRQIIRRETLRRTLEDRWLTFARDLVLNDVPVLRHQAVL